MTGAEIVALVARAIDDVIELPEKIASDACNDAAAAVVAALTEAGRLAPEREEGDIERAIYWAACDMYERGDPVRFRRDIGDEFNWKSINTGDQDAWEALARLAYERFCDRGLFVPAGCVAIDAGRWERVHTVARDAHVWLNADGEESNDKNRAEDALSWSIDGLKPGDIDAEPTP